MEAKSQLICKKLIGNINFHNLPTTKGIFYSFVMKTVQIIDL